jgi:hypothetical protein
MKNTLGENLGVGGRMILKCVFLIRRKVGHWIYLAQSTDKCRDVVKMRMKLPGSEKGRNFLIS